MIDRWRERGGGGEREREREREREKERERGEGKEPASLAPAASPEVDLSVWHCCHWVRCFVC